MRLPSIGTATCGLLALSILALTIFSVFEMNQTRTILARGVQAEATVVDAQHFRYRGDLVTVTFSTLTGNHVTTNVSDSIDASEIGTGDSLDILYDPVHPDRVISAGITSLSHHYVIIPLEILLMIALAWKCIRSWGSPTYRS
ncbi:DUF3592 domain-containing protein [Microtetraspora niveoalba]|uniref:DUF3592 domain-containing protein n=1 Tax=Microtetraspora niveoalba TaxID=46175 RepID=UPI00083090C2|nr:DUF3592 domain-containing protein [Microtetraspora niveoalba]